MEASSLESIRSHNLSNHTCSTKSTIESLLGNAPAAASNRLTFQIGVLEGKKVSFPFQMIVFIPQPILKPSGTDCGLLWYLQNELNLFRSQARDMCRLMRTFTHRNLCTLSWDNPESKCDTRGLEQRSCFERQRRKFMTNRFILKASHVLSADRLADLSRNVTAWAVDIAVQEAIRDFHRAYGLKRQLSLGDDSRNVKQRSV